MESFAYANPSTKEQVVQLLGRKPGAAAVLAGGTDLLSLMKDGVVAPKLVVSLRNVKELSGISKHGDGYRIGARTTLQQLLENQELTERYPSLRQAAEGVRSPQIRNLGTVGGDLCQRPRCWYYRSGFGLVPRHNGTSMVRAGDNRYHAILGNSGDALFVNPSSLAPALIALGAHVQILGPRGERSVALGEFYQTPATESDREYRLDPDELLISVELPAAGPNATYEVRQREVLDWPLAAASVALRMAGGRVREARIVMGHVAPTPWVTEEASRAIIGKTVSEESAQQAGEAAVKGAQALSRNGYKIRLAQVAVKRALLRAAGKEI